MTNPSADVLTAYLSSGETITGTAGHPVFANGEWVLFDSLRYGDTLMSVQEITKCASKSSSTKASSSDDTRFERMADRRYYRPHAGHVRNGVSSLHREIWRDHFGPIPDGHHIHHIDGNPDNNDIENLNASRLAIISAITGTSHHLIASSPNSKRLGCCRRAASVRCWQQPQSGIVSMANVHGKAVPVERKCEQCGGSTPISRSRENASSAPTNASRHGVAPVASMMKIAPALFAGRRSGINKFFTARTCSRVCGARSHRPSGGRI